jgi:integrase
VTSDGAADRPRRRYLVFTDSVGQPVNEDALCYEFREALHRADLPRIRFHDLRHTAATIALGRSVDPKVVSEMLGHSRIAVTLDTYLADLTDDAA